MPRAARTDMTNLVHEARAIELLANETEVAPSDLQEYWDVSAELINLVADIESYGAMHPGAGYDDPEMVDLRRRLRGIAARLTQLALPD